MGAPACTIHVAVTAEVLDRAGNEARVADPRAGAVVAFTGTVRDHHAGKAVSFLEYEGYEAMARTSLREVAEQAAAKWPLLGIAIEHRLGRLQVGDAAVTIAVSAAHRGPAIAAMTHVIDTLKLQVPIWKRETGPDGTFWIEGPEHVAGTSPNEEARPDRRDAKITDHV